MTTALVALPLGNSNPRVGAVEATRTLSGDFVFLFQLGAVANPNFVVANTINPLGVGATTQALGVHNGPLLNPASLQTFDLTWNLLGGVTTASIITNSAEPAAPNRFTMTAFTNFAGSGSPALNTFNFNATTNALSDAAMTTLLNGTVVLTWTESGRDADGTGMFLQMFDSFGQTVGNTSRVSVRQTGDQRDGEVAALSTGGYAVVYEDVLSPTQTAIRASFYAANGSVVLDNVGISGAPFVLRNPDLAAIGGGRVAFVWENETTGDAFVRVFTEAGVAVTGPIQVELSGALGREGNISVKGMTNDTFVVAWTNVNGTIWTTYAQQFTNAGVAIGGPVFVSSVTNFSTPGFNNYENAETEILALSEGGFAVIDPFGAYRMFGQGTGLRDFHEMSGAGRFNAFAGDDIVFGSSGNDTIYGGQGLDVLHGNDGDDTLVLGGLATGTVTTALPSAYGGAGSDRLVAQNSALLDGGAGNDVIIGSAALQGGLGQTRDALYGGAGDDIIRGRGGLDTLYGGDGNDLLVVSGESGSDPLGGSPFVEVFGGAGNDRIVIKVAAVGGGIGVPAVGTGLASAILDGGDGADFILASGASDSLSGGSGNDTMIGGGGDDILTGGADSDFFSFRSPGFGDDVVTDFQNGVDRFQFVGFGTANFASLVLTTVGGNVEIEGPLAAGTITVLNAAGQIDATDFIFVA